VRAGREPCRLPETLLGLALLAAAFLLPSAAEARCDPELVRRPGGALLRRVADAGREAAPRISIEWFGHSAFHLVSPGGTRLLTDPFGPELGLPVPEVSPHAITVGREHPHHNSVWVARGAPLVLRGLGEGGMAWAEVRKTVGDVLVYNVPVTQRTFEVSTKGSAFVFEMGGLCIAHLGDVAEALTPSQLRRLGKVHVAMIPIGGTFTVGPEEAVGIVRQVQPNIAIPMHYWDDEDRLQRFLRGVGHQVRRVGRGPFFVSRENLPRPTLVVVLSHD